MNLKRLNLEILNYKEGSNLEYWISKKTKHQKQLNLECSNLEKFVNIEIF
jgi:hypothetical protein